MHAKKDKRAPERRSQGGSCDRERATKKNGERKGADLLGQYTKQFRNCLEDPIHKIFRKNWGSSKKLEDDPQYLSWKTLNPQNLLRILHFYPQKLWRSSKFSLNIEDFPRSFGKEILKIFGGFILKIFWGCSAEKIFEDFLGWSEFPKIFRSSPKNPQNMVFFFLCNAIPTLRPPPTREKRKKQKFQAAKTDTEVSTDIGLDKMQP